MGRTGERPIAQIGEAVDILSEEPSHELMSEEGGVHIRSDAAL